MGSIAEEMRKVIQQWDVQDEPQQEETKVKATEENTKGSITKRILSIIENNPGINSIDLRSKLSVLHTDIPQSFTSSMLKQFTDRFYVSRAISPIKVGGRDVYAYTLVPEDQRKGLQNKAKKEHEKAVARAAHARAMKEQKKAEKESQGGAFVPYEKKSISDLVEQYKEVNAKIEQAKPTEWSVDGVLDNLTVKQARALHIALKEMFGGV
jgi:hypothetical protein